MCTCDGWHFIASMCMCVFVRFSVKIRMGRISYSDKLTLQSTCAFMKVSGLQDDLMPLSGPLMSVCCWKAVRVIFTYHVNLAEKASLICYTWNSSKVWDSYHIQSIFGGGKLNLISGNSYLTISHCQIKVN